MGCANSKDSDLEREHEEVVVDIPEPTWEPPKEEEVVVEAVEEYEEEEEPTPGEGPPGVVMEGGKAFVRRSSGSSMKMKTKKPQEMKQVKSNAATSPKSAEVCEVLPKLSTANGVAKQTGSEFQKVATRRSSATILGVGGSGDSAVLNAEEKSKFADTDSEQLALAKSVPQESLTKSFIQAASDPNSPTDVRNMSFRPKTTELEAQELEKAKKNNKSNKTIQLAAKRNAKFSKEQQAEMEVRQGLKPKPTTQQSEAAFEAAKEKAKKTKFGVVDTLPEGFSNASKTTSHIVNEPPPKVNKAAKNAIKQAHEEVAAQQRKELKNKKKVLGAAATDKKHFKANAKSVKLDPNDVEAAQKEREAEEAEFNAHMEAQLAEAKAEKEKKAAEDQAAAEAKADEEARRSKIKEDLKKSAAEARAKKAKEDEEARVAAEIAKKEARRQAAIEHQSKHSSDVPLPELRGAKQ